MGASDGEQEGALKNQRPRQSDALMLDTKSEDVTTMEKLNEENLPAFRYRYAGKIGDSDVKVKLLFCSNFIVLTHHLVIFCAHLKRFS